MSPDDDRAHAPGPPPAALNSEKPEWRPRSGAATGSADVSCSPAHVRFHSVPCFFQAQSCLLTVELDGLNLLGGIIRELLDIFGQAFRAGWIDILDVQMTEDGIDLLLQASRQTDRGKFACRSSTATIHNSGQLARLTEAMAKGAGSR